MLSAAEFENRHPAPVSNYALVYSNNMTHLKFRYINHRGEDHEYVVRPFVVNSVVFTRCKCFADDPEREAWALRAHVVQRDGRPRPGDRTFALIKMRNIEEVPAIIDALM